LVDVIKEVYDNMRVHGMEYFKTHTKKAANFMLCSIAGNEGIIQRHDQEHTKGRYALQNSTHLSALLFLVEGDKIF
jgi:hypothetical protein